MIGITRHEEQPRPTQNSNQPRGRHLFLTFSLLVSIHPIDSIPLGVTFTALTHCHEFITSVLIKKSTPEMVCQPPSPGIGPSPKLVRIQYLSLDDSLWPAIV